MNSLSSKSKPLSNFLLSKSKSPSSSSKFFCISFFTTSSSSSNPPLPLRRHDEDSKNVRVSVWWDIENCGVPSGINVFKISHFITSAVRVNGIKGPVQVNAFGDILSLNRTFQEALSSTGVNLVHIPQGRKNSVDRSLLVDLMYWISQNPPPAHIFLISGDKDFAVILHKLRMNNYNILLAGKEGKQTPGVLCSAASIMWHWNELARGESLSGRHFNQPPDGPYNSWYGHYKGPLEDPYEVSEASKKNCGSEVDNLSNAELSSESKYRPVPLAVLRQLRRTINSYPEGLDINELRYAIAKYKVSIDKDFYGYKKLSRFLQSIPHIVKVESCPDGQYYLCPVPKKVREPVEANVPSSGVVTEEKSQDVEVTRKANDQTPTITRMVDVEPKLPVSPYVNCGETSNGLSSRFKNSSPLENPQSRIIPAVDEKPSQKTRTEVLADCQSLLDELLSQNTDGFNMGLFKPYFREKYKYDLDHRKLGYPKLISLLQIMPGVKIESAHVYSDKVVFSPGIESLGVTNKSSGSDSDSDSSRKNEEDDSPWEELGPMTRESSTPNGNYEPLVSDDDEFSELKEDATSSPAPAKAEDQKRSRVNEEDSALIQILDSWYGTSNPRYQGSQHEFQRLF